MVSNQTQNLTQNRDTRPKECFHPTSLHKSARDLYRMYFNGDQQKVSPRVQRIFDNGSHVLTRLQEYLSKIGILKQVEVPVENEEYNIRGHADGIIEISGVEGVLEIKSINQNQSFARLAPKPDHLVQLNVYMFCLGIPRGAILYECKNDQELKEFFVKQDDAILKPVLEKIRFVQQCIREGKQPPTEGDVKCQEMVPSQW